MHSRQWTDDQDPAKMEERKRPINLNLQYFARKTGDYRRTEWGSNWPEGSLKETVSRFARGSKPTPSRDKQKIEYRSKDGHYIVKYDKKGDYFRIIDNHATEPGRMHVDLNGNRIVDVTEDGKQRSVTLEEYERRTHFKNTDKRGR